MSVLHVHVTPSTTTTTTTCQTIDGFNECFISIFFIVFHIYFLLHFHIGIPIEATTGEERTRNKKSNNVFTKIKMTFIPEVLRSA